MGSSKRKKNQKAKDFVKPKLKVGKTAAKPANQTDTSFKAKTIALPNQLIVRKVTSEQELIHQLLLTKHHSEQTRKEVLQNLEASLPENPSLYKQILASVVPLILDPEVQPQLLSLLKKCATAQVGLMDLHIRTVVLFVLLAMSHIRNPVRNNSLKFLDILIEYAPLLLVEQYFVKVLKNYFSLMSWTLLNDKKAVSLAVTTALAQGGLAKKARPHHLQVLARFLKIALFDAPQTHDDMTDALTIHPQLFRYLVPTAPQVFAPLKLFVNELPKVLADVSFADIDLVSAEDIQTRQWVFHDMFMPSMVKGLTPLVKEGGEVGREANNILALLDEFSTTYKKQNLK